MEEMEEEVPEIRLCDVSNEVEAALVVNLLQRGRNPCAAATPRQPCPSSAASPLSPGTPSLFPPHRPRSPARFCARYPHFKNLKNVHEPDL